MEKYNVVNSKLKDGVCLWGAGANGIWVSEFCEENGIKVLAFIDSDTNKHNTIINNIKCISYDEYKNDYSDKVVFVTSKHYVNEIMDNNSDNPYLYPFDCWLAITYEKEYRKLIFEDDKSYETLEYVLASMKKTDVRELYNIAEDKQYFCCSPFFGKINETFVDLGAYTGETLEQFINSVGGVFNHIYAFEPSDKSYNAMCTRLKRVCEEWAISSQIIKLEKMCVGGFDGELSFDTSGTSTNAHISGEGSNRVKSITLDSYFKNIDISFLKADIEGAEFDVLKNGQETITRCKPKLAICVYHRPNDILKIYNYVNDLDLGYKFKLRHHSCEVTETVLYCYC